MRGIGTSYIYEEIDQVITITHILSNEHPRGTIEKFDVDEDHTIGIGPGLGTCGRCHRQYFYLNEYCGCGAKRGLESRYFDFDGGQSQFGHANQCSEYLGRDHHYW